MRKIVKIITFLIIIVWILINIFSVLDLSFLGFRIFKIGSGSMEPYLKENDLIIIKVESNYNKNDIVTFYENNHYITHRIVDINEDIITTKGDNNNSTDNNIRKNQIIGKMIYKFKILGFIRYMLIHSYSWLLIFIIGIIVIFIFPVETREPKHLKK